MLKPIHLDDQPGVEADKIRNVPVERNLPFEFEPFQLTITQRLSQQVLRQRCIRSHCFRKMTVLVRDLTMHEAFPKN